MSEPFNHCGHYNSPADMAAIADLARRARIDKSDTVAVELGVWTGQATRVIADAGHFVFAVDHWRGGDDRLGEIVELMTPAVLFRTFVENMGLRLLTSVVPVVGGTVWVGKRWHSPIDFLFIDASHDRDSVLQDITVWTQHVKPGGIIAGHDAQVAGVWEAVEATGGAEIMGDSVWWREKK